MPYVGKKPADIIATAIDTTTGDFSGVVTANAGIKVDNITIDATEVDLSSGTFTIDSASDITLDADGGGVLLKDGGTEFGRIFNSSSDLILKSAISDKDMKFQGNDGGSAVNALILDMSDAGTAIFGSSIETLGQNTTHGASRMKFGQDSTSISQIRFYGADTSTAGILQFIGSSSDASAGGERMRILSGGEVAIGGSGYSGQPFSVQTSTSELGYMQSTGSTRAVMNFVDANSSNNVGFGAIGNNHVFMKDANEKMRIDSSGNVLIGTTGSMDLGFGAQRLSVRTIDGNAPLIVGNGHNTSGAGFICYASSQSYASNLCDLRVGRSASTAYNFFEMRSNSAVANDSEFRFRGDGNAFADGSFSGGGADYAEYFEWKDGNTDNEDRRGYTVVLDGHQIRKSTSDDNASTIIGVVSGNPSMVGDSDINQWKHKYQRDNYGTYISDKNGDRVLNSSYDDTKEYVSREDRQEWNTIGLMGKLRVRVGQTVGSNWIKMREISDTVHEYLVR